MPASHRRSFVPAALCALAATAILAAPGAAFGQQDADSESGGERPAKVRIAHLTLTGVIPEGPDAAGPLAELQPGLRKMIARIEKAAEDDSVQGLVLNLQNPSLGRGGVNELRAAIKRYRESGKRVYAQLETATAADYLVSCACDEVTMPESGLLVLPGVRAEGLFMEGLLTKLGVEADFIHMGDAKGAAEMFTRKAWSDPVRENLTALVDDLYVQLVETVGLDRPVTEQEAREAIDKGLLTAREALERKLIDRLAYPDQVRERLSKTHAAENLVLVKNYGAASVDTDFSGPTGLFKLLGLLSGSQSSAGDTSKKIAVVYAVGPIMTGESEADLFGSTTVGSTTIVEALQQAARDERVAAIVLRVNSPGGSAVASDLIWRATREIDKPIVASMGDTAASGGYYISMGADKIFAEPQSVTGSIGVVGGKFALGGLYEKVGVSTEVISRGKNSGVFSTDRPFSQSERAALRAMMEDVYGQFTSKAAAGRGMEIEELKSLAGGRVYTGRQAKENGLIDQLGTLKDAVAEAKELAGLDADEEVKLETLPEPTDFFESLFGGGEKEKEVAVRLEGLALPPEAAGAVRNAVLWGRLLERERVGVFMPVQVVIE